jgi:hypothetical protein
VTRYPTKRQAQLSFEGGALIVMVEGHPGPGSGHFAFTDDELEPVREYTEDGVWDGFLAKLPASELMAIRDFLNKWLPPTPAGNSRPQSEPCLPGKARASVAAHDEPSLPSPIKQEGAG